MTWELKRGGALPPFEIWLSEDGTTWWDANEINGWNLEAGVEYEAALRLWTQYVMLVVSDVDESGLDAVGGFGEISIWPAAEAQSLASLGEPVTPEPEPTDVPVEEPIAETSVEEIATEEAPDAGTTEAPVEPEGEAVTEEPAPDGVESPAEPDSTTEETPPPG